jgi:hypothetical protein
VKGDREIKVRLGNLIKSEKRVRHDIDIQKERQAFKIDIAPKKEMYKEIH